MPASLSSSALTPEIQPEGLGNAVSSGGSGLTRPPNVFVLQTAKKVQFYCYDRHWQCPMITEYIL